MSIRTRRNSKRLLAGVLAGAFALSGVAISSTASADDVSADADLDRISGSDRYATAVAVAQAVGGDDYASIGTVILATGTNFPDGLAAAGLVGGLTGASDAVILLTETNALPAATANAIEEMENLELVVVMGGKAAISDAVIDQVAALQVWTPAQVANQVVRIDGANRYDTALKATELWVSLGVGGIAEAIDNCAIIATGENFPDALSAGSMAVNGPCPILLNSGSTIRPEVTAGLAAIGTTPDVYVVGGTSVIPNSVVTALRAAGHTVTRLSGPNRYATAQAIANFINTDIPANANGTTVVGAYAGPGCAVVASGTNFPDALAAAPLTGIGSPCFVLGAPGLIPILLVDPASIPPSTTSWLTANNNTLNDVLVVGGTAAVSAATATAVKTGATAPAPTIVSTLGLITDTESASVTVTGSAGTEFTLEANPSGRLAGLAGNGWTVIIGSQTAAANSNVINNQARTITVNLTAASATVVGLRAYWASTTALNSLFIPDDELIGAGTFEETSFGPSAGGGNVGFVVSVLNTVCSRDFPGAGSIQGTLASGPVATPTSTQAVGGAPLPGPIFIGGFCGNNTQQNPMLWDNAALYGALSVGAGLTPKQIATVAAALPAAPLVIWGGPFNATFQRVEVATQGLTSSAALVNPATVRSNITWLDVEL